MALVALTTRHDVTWHWVRGHAGHPENERADALANDCLGKARRDGRTKCSLTLAADTRHAQANGVSDPRRGQTKGVSDTFFLHQRLLVLDDIKGKRCLTPLLDTSSAPRPSEATCPTPHHRPSVTLSSLSISCRRR